jgi:hypothetical protein
MRFPLLTFGFVCGFAFSVAAQTTVTTDPNAPPPQVVVNPPPSDAPQIVVNPPPADVQPNGIPQVEAVPSGRSAVAIVATDAIYGGVAGGVIGGGVTLIDQGRYWARDLMIGAGVGVLVGAAYGAFEVASAPKVPVRAVADRNSSASDPLGSAPVQTAMRF